MRTRLGISESSRRIGALGRAPRLAGALALFGVSSALAACGGSGHPSTGSSGAGAPASNSSGSPASKQETAHLQFAQCLREHGVNISDQGLSASPNALKVPQSTLRAAFSACGKYQAASSGASPTQQNEGREAVVSYARCLRKAGLNVPEPTGTDIASLAAFRQALGEQEQSPAFQKANEACKSSLPSGR